MMPVRKFWIRKDREIFFLSGVIVTCIIGGLVSTYWHFSDRLAVKANITLHQKKISKAQESRKLKETQFYAPKFQAGSTQYYKLEEERALPRIPDLPEVNDGN